MSTKTLKPLGVVKGMGTLVKARFGAGMLLQHEDMEALGAYTQNLNRLMFRTLLGCGVMCGLVVTLDTKCGLVVKVAKGVALDCGGDPIEVTETKAISVDEDCDAVTPKHLWVVLCAKYKCCAPRASMCASDDDDDEAPSTCTRERYGYEIRVLREHPKCACQCESSTNGKDTDWLQDSNCKCANPENPCYQGHYGVKCGCDCDDGTNCECDCIVLARLDNKSDNEVASWVVTHRVRRFIRPVLMEDPQVRAEHEAQKILTEQQPVTVIRNAKKATEQKPSQKIQSIKPNSSSS